MEPEILVTVQFRMTQVEALDRRSFANRMAPLMVEAVAIGGDKVTISTQPYDPDDMGD
jgi:hypothetical protein